MLNAVQANLLVSQKVIRWSYSDKRAFKFGGNVSFVIKFLFRYFLYFLRNKLTCTFQTLTAYLHEESDVFLLYCISTGLSVIVLFCLGVILVISFFS